MKFNPEVTTGHLLQILTVAASAVALFIGIDRRVVYIESLTANHKEQLVRHEEVIQRLTKVESDIAVAQARIVTILEERSRTK